MATSVFLYVPNIIGYIRIVLWIASLFTMMTQPYTTAILYGLSQLLDAFDGYAARLLNQSSRFGGMLDMLTDRASLLTMLMCLGVFYSQFLPLFQLLTAVDIVAHWQHQSVAYITGNESHKTSKNVLLNLYYTSRPVLFFMCAGTEAFFGSLYMLHFSKGPDVNSTGLGLWQLLAYCLAPIAVVKTIISVLHLVQASIDIVNFEERRQVASKSH